MGLFRLAAIVAVGVSLLPSESEKQQQLYTRAASAATWTLTFCERNAVTCTQASGLWTEFGKKAEFGAKLAYDVIRENQVATATGTEAAAPASFEVAPPSPTHVPGTAAASTLTERDMKPAWRGKTASKRGI
jgi:Family of unknown function (DUF5330)